MELYTMEQWQKDREFKAKPGQEISGEIYEQMLNCMPPKEMDKKTALHALHDLKIPVHAGFLMGEPHSSDKRGELYLTFAMNDYGKGKHYFYIGLSHPAPVLNGKYYYMDCLNAFVNDGLFPVAEFESEQEAIKTAANYEATLYLFEYDHNKRISSTVIYDPFAMFNEEGPQDE